MFDIRRENIGAEPGGGHDSDDEPVPAYGQEGYGAVAEREEHDPLCVSGEKKILRILFAEPGARNC